MDLCTFPRHTAAVGSLCVQATGRRSFQSVSPSSWSVRTKQEPGKKSKMRHKHARRTDLPLGGNRRKREKPSQMSSVNNKTDCLEQQSHLKQILPPHSPRERYDVSETHYCFRVSENFKVHFQEHK